MSMNLNAMYRLVDLSVLLQMIYVAFCLVDISIIVKSEFLISVMTPVKAI